MPRVKRISEVKEILRNKDQIRNIGIIAHVDHGKCISGDSIVCVSDGRLVRIRELYESAAMGRQVERVSVEGLMVDSVDPNDLNVKDRNVRYVWKLKSDRIVRVRLRTGFTLATTPEHPFFVLTRSGIVTWKRADELKVGDRVAVPAVLKSIPKDLSGVKEIVLSRLDPERYIAYLSPDLKRLIYQELRRVGIRDVHALIASPIGYKTFCAGARRGRFRLGDLLRIADRLGLRRDEVYDGIAYLAYRSSIERTGRLSKKIRLPKSSSAFLKLAYLYGLLVGDGTTRASLTTTNRQILSRYVRYMRECFGVSCRTVRMRTTLRVDHHGGLTLIYFLHEVFGYPLKKKARSVPFPELLAQMGNQYLAAFLRGLYDTDGSVEMGRRAVTLSTASEDLGEKLPIVLLRLGIVSSVSRKGPYRVVAVSGSQLLPFASKVGFSDVAKRRRLAALLKRLSANRAVDLIPIEPEELRDLRIALGLSASSLRLPYYAKYEAGEQQLTRDVLRAVVERFSSALSDLDGARKRLTVIRHIEGVGSIKELSAVTGIPVHVLRGLIASLRSDGLIEREGMWYALTEEGRFFAEIWQDLVEGDGRGRDRITRILENWRKLCDAEVRFVEVTDLKEERGEFDVYDLTVEGTSTFIANGVVVHNTTTTDSLLAAAGLLSPALAGKALALDYLEEEQQRQMTIKAANISLYYELDSKPYIINLIDTPGHVDFSGRVTRALRAIDGAIVVVDAVEGVMTQTETVIRQALGERVKPVLYINKIDRLIKELRLTPEKIQEVISRIVLDVNRLIEMYAEPEYKDAWKVSFQAGTVAMGSSKDRWGFTLQQAQKKGVKFSDIMKAFNEGNIDWLRETLPLHEAILEMVIKNHPPPHVAQRYRIPKIWKGDIESEVGKDMIECNDSGIPVMIVTDVKVDPQAGVVATGRLFSGTVRDGDVIKIVGRNIERRIQQVTVYMGPNREIVNELPAGNIPALLGIEEARAGDTLSTIDMVPFESLKYVSDPVVTVAIEPKHSKDLPKLIEFLNKLTIEDPTLVTTIRPETGEYLISGMGTLHLEIALTWIQKAGLEVVAGKPIILYRESVLKRGKVFEGKSPNKHNRIYIYVEKLEDEVVELIRRGELFDEMDRRTIAKILRDHGWDTDEARGVWMIDPNGNIFVDMTKGAQYLHETKAYILSGFQRVVQEGPLAGEKVRGMKVVLVNVDLHEDPVHRGLAQIAPATWRAIYASMLTAEPTLLEPIMRIDVKVPQDFMGAVTSIISSKRGKISNVVQSEYVTTVIGEIPAAEAGDLADQMRAATMGKAFWGMEFAAWRPVPASLFEKVVMEIRKRKGMPLKLPTVEDFVEEA
jgi:elongation factor 2